MYVGILSVSVKAQSRSYMISIIVCHPLRIKISAAIIPAQMAPKSKNIAPRIVRLSGGMYWVSIQERQTKWLWRTSFAVPTGVRHTYTA
jgi:hypothetical protein